MRRWIILPLLLLTSCTRSEKLDLTRLQLPSGFHISIFGKAKSARMMAWSPGGVLLVTGMNEGKVFALPDSKHTGRAEKVFTVLHDLNAPHGIAFHDGKLYIAETNAVRRYDWDEANLRAGNPQLIAKIPGGGGHFSRTLLFANGKMYVQIGSTCNVCQEDDNRRASVLEFNPDGSGEKIFASGLRNSVGLAINPRTGTIWATDNGRDWLGDDTPPEEINDLGKNGGFFGWPYCYGDKVTDTSQAQSGEDRCPSSIPPKVAMQAHSAALGLAFYTAEMFPPEYRGNIFVAMHGSWNRMVPTGYKVVRIKLDDKGEPQRVEDFITGWINPGETRRGLWMGRPVGILIGAEGSIYVSDDYAGIIYRVTYAN